MPDGPEGAPGDAAAPAEQQELTPSLKIKRAVGAKNYADLIESIFSAPVTR